MVAIVDDDEAFRESLGALLAVTARRVQLFANAESFLRTLEMQSFSCVILDVHMPGLSEASAVAAVRQAAPGLRIISVSGRAEPGDCERMLAAGSSAFLEKPLVFKELDKLIGQ